MKDFLCGPGFAGLVASFGWTVGRNWPLVLASEVTPIARQAVFSTRQIKQLTPFVDLAQLSEHEAREARSAVTGFEAVLAVSAFDPTRRSPPGLLEQHLALVTEADALR